MCNIGYQKGYSVPDVIEVVKRVSGVDFPETLSGRRASDPAAIVASNGRAEGAHCVLGYSPGPLKPMPTFSV